MSTSMPLPESGSPLLAFAESLQQAQEVALFTYLVLRRREAYLGAVGVGIVGSPPHVALLVDNSRLPAAGTSPWNPHLPRLRLSQSSAIMSALIEDIGSLPEWASNGYAYLIPDPEPQLGTGDAIKAAGTPGTLGCAASWSGSTGFLTAGHVVKAAKSVIPVTSSRLIGSVLFANDPSGKGTSIEADVALIDFGGAGTSASISGPSHAASMASVNISTARGTLTDTVVGFLTYVCMRGGSMTVGDAYMTGLGVTAGGDSGAAVCLPSGQIVGHVVGGVPNVLSYVQSIHYQVAKLRSVSPYSSLTV